jgi:DNA-binding Lrp family transcriptional regulator
MLAEQGKNGTLYINKEGKQAHISFHEGAIVCATGCQQDRRLGYILKKNGHINVKTLNAAINRSRLEAQSLGKTLIESGAIDKTTLRSALRQQALDLICDLNLGDNGDFEFKATPLNFEATQQFSFSPIQLLIEASRRIDEMSGFREKRISDQNVYVLSHRIFRESVIRLKADEWRILSLLDGDRKVRDLVDISGCSRFGVFKVLYAMLTAGFVEQVHMPGPESLESTVDEERRRASSPRATPRKGGLLSFFRR